MANIASSFFKQIDDNVAALGSRIYPKIAPQSSAKPFVVYELDSTEPFDTLDGFASSSIATFTVTIWDESYSDVKTVATAVEAALKDVSGTVDTIVIDFIRHDNTSDEEAWSGDGAEFPLYGIEQTYKVAYQS
tara:strand:+ start:702 stop:1100 length:399 start_codon:yes stop_codon:yes gene_type:complete